MICTFCFYEGNSFLNENTHDYNWSYFSKSNDKLPKEHINKECKYNDIYIPIFLTTLNSIVTKYGLYDKYIPAGVYICKFLDYTQQCTMIEQDISNTCNDSYSFIADRYYDMYPLNKLANTGLINKIIDNLSAPLIKKYLDDPIKFDTDKVKIIVNEYNKNTLKTPLIYAIESNNPDTVNLLLEKGASVNYINKLNNSTPLLYAIESGKSDIIELILRKKPNIEHINNESKTALDIAIDNNNLDIINLLIDKGAIYKNRIKKLISINSSLTIKPVISLLLSRIGLNNTNLIAITIVLDEIILIKDDSIRDKLIEKIFNILILYAVEKKNIDIFTTLFEKYENNINLKIHASTYKQLINEFRSLAKARRIKVKVKH
jgi:hypothetical protein